MVAFFSFYVRISLYWHCLNFSPVFLSLTSLFVARFYSRIQIRIKRKIIVWDRLPSILMKKKQPTCVMCYDDKDLIKFDLDFTNSCCHLSWSICNSCLLHHIEGVGVRINFIFYWHRHPQPHPPTLRYYIYFSWSPTPSHPREY